MMNSMLRFQMSPVSQSARILLAVLSIALAIFIVSDARAAQTPETVKKARQACSRLAEKLANARKLKTNTVQSSSNYNLDKDTCFAQIEISQVLQSKNISENTNASQSETKGAPEGENKNATEGKTESAPQGENQDAAQNEKRHRQIILMNATENKILAIAMWEEPKGLRVGHVYDPSYDGPRDEYEKVEAYMRKKMALNLR